MKKSELTQLIKEEISKVLNENSPDLDSINKSRKALFGAKSLMNREFAFFEDEKAKELLNQLIGYLQNKIEDLGGNIN
jgi:hypothetical protein